MKSLETRIKELENKIINKTKVKNESIVGNFIALIGVMVKKETLTILDKQGNEITISDFTTSQIDECDLINNVSDSFDVIKLKRVNGFLTISLIDKDNIECFIKIKQENKELFGYMLVKLINGAI